MAVAHKRTDRKHVHCIADVNSNRHAMFSVDRWQAAAKLAAVLDVVVDQKGIVKQLDRGRRTERIGELAPVGAACADT